MEICKYDPIREWDKYCIEEEIYAASRPVCSECGTPIYESSCYKLDGKYICECCMYEHKIDLEYDYE